MSHIPNSTNSQGPFSPYQLLPDDAKAEVMKYSSLKQLDAGLAKSDKTSNRVALDLVKTVALELIQVVDSSEKLWKDLNRAISDQASDSKVHDAFKAAIKTCELENIPLMDVARHIQARQTKAASCGISLSEYQKISACVRSKTTNIEDIVTIIKEVSVAKGVDFQNLAAQLLTERDMALAFVQKNPMLYEGLSLEFRADKEIILAAIAEDCEVLKFASPELKADKQVVLAALKERGLSLEFASPELQSDKEVVMVAVTQNGWALQYAEPKLKADKEVVMAALKSNHNALKFASLELRADREVVLSALTKYNDVLRYASVELQRDPDILAVYYRD